MSGAQSQPSAKGRRDLRRHKGANEKRPRRHLSRKALIRDLTGLCAGAVGFIFSVPPAVLIPNNVDWLLGEDPASAYLGWEFFRRDEWRIPLGANPRFGLENASSIVYSDSLPILALPSKLFSSFVAGPFQYFGAWLLICFLLQGIFSARLLGRFTLGPLPTLFGSLLACFLPFHLCRLSYGYGHIALFGHFLILAALLLSLEKTKFPTRRWTLLLGASLGIHAYLFFMVAVFCAFQLVGLRNVRLTSRIASGSVVSSVVLLISWTLGYFEIDVRDAAMSVGGFRAHPASLIGSLARGGISWSHTYVTSNLSGDGEGFVFLGLGAISLIALSVVIRITTCYERWVVSSARVSDTRTRRPAFSPSTYLAASVLAILSLRPVVVFGSAELRIPIPQMLAGALDPFRANGRFLWPLAYVLLFAGLAAFASKSQRVSSFVFVGALFLQIVDSSGARSIGYEKLAEGYNYFPSKRAWLDEALNNSALEIDSIRVPGSSILKPISSDRSELWFDLANFALENSLTTNFVYTARPPSPDSAKFGSIEHYLRDLTPKYLLIIAEEDLEGLQAQRTLDHWHISDKDGLLALSPR